MASNVRDARIAFAKDGHHRLLALPGERRDFDFTFLDIEERVGGVALSENDLALVPFRDAYARADRGEKRLGIEDRLGSFDIAYAKLALFDCSRRRSRSRIFLPFVSCFAQTPPLPLLKCAMRPGYIPLAVEAALRRFPLRLSASTSSQAFPCGPTPGSDFLPSRTRRRNQVQLRALDLEVPLDHATAIYVRMLSDIGLVTEPHKMRANRRMNARWRRILRDFMRGGKLPK